MGKTRDLFKKIRDTKGTFCAKMGSIKDRNGMDITEAGDIKKRWPEYKKELYKKDLHNPEWPKCNFFIWSAGDRVDEDTKVLVFQSFKPNCLNQNR